jgi:hypothetical protein
MNKAKWLIDSSCQKGGPPSRNQRQALDELSAEELDSMAETVVTAALSGNIWAVQVIARAIDE